MYLDTFLRVMPRLRQRQHAAATMMLLNGSSQSTVAAHFGVHRSTISRVYERLRTNRTTDDRPRSGRPRVTSFGSPARDFACQGRQPRIFLDGTTIARTVRNHLRDLGIRARRPYAATNNDVNDEWPRKLHVAAVEAGSLY